MTAPLDDDASQAPAPQASALPGAAAASQAVEAPAPADGRSGAHAQPIDVPDVPARPSIADRRRYFLSSQEPSGDFEAVIVAVTDAGRRRYFTTRDGARLTEVDHDWFDRRSSDGGRSLLELDERELGELEAELEFVRPVRGRDPIAEAADAPSAPATASDADAGSDVAAGSEDDLPAGADTETDPEPEPEPEPDADVAPGPAIHEEQHHMTDATPAHTPAGPADDELDPVTQEFEAIVLEARRATFVQGGGAAATESDRPTSAPAASAPVAGAPAASAPGSPFDRSPDGGAIEQVALAKGIAFIAHRGRLDRSGAPYIDHPGRIAERFDAVSEPVAAAAAWLHDVLEDTDITAEELFEAGVVPEVIEVVRLLTRTPEVAADEYYARLRSHPIARRVKLADIDDNTARWRLRRLDYETQVRLVEKYRVARLALAD
ncbi:hypothetical protein [Agromyces arachidis]|uniref:hypothetical protein n=1 Tax=Agromyces arachidis TaxID=766966 RepID=UPI0040570B1C